MEEAGRQQFTLAAAAAQVAAYNHQSVTQQSAVAANANAAAASAFAANQTIASAATASANANVTAAAAAAGAAAQYPGYASLSAATPRTDVANPGYLSARYFTFNFSFLFRPSV